MSDGRSLRDNPRSSAPSAVPFFRTSEDRSFGCGSAALGDPRFLFSRTSANLRFGFAALCFPRLPWSPLGSPFRLPAKIYETHACQRRTDQPRCAPFFGNQYFRMSTELMQELLE